MIYNYTKQCGIMHGSVLFTRARVKQAVYKHVYKVSLMLHYEPVVAVFSQLSRFTGHGLPHIVHVICNGRCCDRRGFDPIQFGNRGDVGGGSVGCQLLGDLFVGQPSLRKLAAFGV